MRTRAPAPRRQTQHPPQVVFAAVPAGVLAYSMLAFVLGWWPFIPPPPAVCPADTTAYHFFEDGTGSTSDRSNWSPAANGLANGLKPCDCVSFYKVTDDTPGTPEVAEKIAMPAPLAPDASNFERATWIEATNKARRAILAQLETMVRTESTVRKSDILGIFYTLYPVTVTSDSPENVLVIFSDGLESGPKSKVNLEKGHSCIKDHLPGLIDEALMDARGLPGELRHYRRVVWVFPAKAELDACNSFLELKQFWQGVLDRWSGSLSGGGPALTFSNNDPF